MTIISRGTCFHVTMTTRNEAYTQQWPLQSTIDVGTEMLKDQNEIIRTKCLDVNLRSENVAGHQDGLDMEENLKKLLKYSKRVWPGIEPGTSRKQCCRVNPKRESYH
ncbi:hypothetical protein F5Y08DRAFT_322663 [Xylaria arbuscula]|nr:hypothetical protein F5Y08DRAFT_322663 [Xylaria arbuscula]